MPTLSIAEVSREQKTFAFAASLCGETWVCAWVHKRGVLDKDSSDGGHDLIVMEEGKFPQVVISGASSLSSPSFDEHTRFVVAVGGKELVIGSAKSLQVHTWHTLPKDESFQGSPTWADRDVLFVTSGGTPTRSRLCAICGPDPVTTPGVAAPRTLVTTVLFTAENGGGVMSWDRCDRSKNVVVVHRLANAMAAEVILLRRSTWAVDLVAGEIPPPHALNAPPRVIACDARVEYSRPQAAFLADGRLVARLNLAAGASAVTHGLWTLDVESLPRSLDSPLPQWEPLHACATLGEHGAYDVCSSSYANAHGVKEGFILDRARKVLAFTARSHDPARGMADQVFVVPVTSKPHRTSVCGLTLASGKGCHVPVALAGDTLVYHFRSPTEAGDLWAHGLSSAVALDCVDAEGAAPSAVRLTSTMPIALRAKLTHPPEEVVIGGQHALLYRPAPSDTPAPAIVWAHGGPMAAFSFDYNPIASWLASLGYVVLVPNFAGSVGFGIAHMDKVLGEGCGVVDLEDCVACAQFAKTLDGVDTRRGVAIAGHSWGGFLTLRALTTPGALEAFSCGIATAGIADWYTQQRHTEVRYYDFALMGGWVYEPQIRDRAKERSPTTHVANLQSPLLVLHGEADIDVPFAQVKAFVDAARAARRDEPGAPALEFVSFAGEGHGMGGWKPVTKAAAFKQLQDFLRIHLKPWDFTDNPHGDLTAY